MHVFVVVSKLFCFTILVDVPDVQHVRNWQMRFSCPFSFLRHLPPTTVRIKLNSFWRKLWNINIYILLLLVKVFGWYSKCTISSNNNNNTNLTPSKHFFFKSIVYHRDVYDATSTTVIVYAIVIIGPYRDTEVRARRTEEGKVTENFLRVFHDMSYVCV